MHADNDFRADLRAACDYLRAQIRKDPRMRDAFGSVAPSDHARLLRIAVAILELPNPLGRERLCAGITDADLQHSLQLAAYRYGSHPALGILHVHNINARTRAHRVGAGLGRDTLNLNPAFRRPE